VVLPPPSLPEQESEYEDEDEQEYGEAELLEGGETGEDFDKEPEYIAEPELGEEAEAESLEGPIEDEAVDAEPLEDQPLEDESRVLEALELEDEPEDIWSEDSTEKVALPVEEPPQIEESPPQQAEPGPVEAAEPAAEPSQEGERPQESLIGEPAVRLLEYLKGLADELPPNKQEEFDVPALKLKIDDLIGKLKKESERSKEPPPILPRERGVGLLASGGALRDSDPRRSGLGRRAGIERREAEKRRDRVERRKEEDRRNQNDLGISVDRRLGERRGPVPAIDLSEPISREAAEMKLGADGNPTEIAGLTISPRMAKLIQIMRREKNDAR